MQYVTWIGANILLWSTFEQNAQSDGTSIIYKTESLSIWFLRLHNQQHRALNEGRIIALWSQIFLWSLKDYASSKKTGRFEKIPQLHFVIEESF